MKKINLLVISCICCFLFQDCNSFRYNVNAKNAFGYYNLITGDKRNNGDKRLKIAKNYFKNSDLTLFLRIRPQPAFIYEYINKEQCSGITLFYPVIDSFFAFQTPNKRNLNIELVEARPMDPGFKSVYERLLLQPGISLLR